MTRKRRASGCRPSRSLPIRDDGELLLLIGVLEEALAGGDIVGRSRSTVDRWLAQLRSMGPPTVAEQNVFDLDGRPHVPARESDLVQGIFDHWRSKMNKPRARLDARRRTRIVQRLRDGYTADEIRTAIDGCAGDDWSRGANDRGVAFDDIELICRDSTRLERFIALAISPPRKRSITSRGKHDIEAARAAWVKVVNHVRAGRYRSGAGVDDGGPIDAAVAAIGGYRHIGQSHASELRFIERRFVECYFNGAGDARARERHP